jgi:stress response protein YsnF
MIIPVMREVLVVQKQLMLAEEIRIRKREVTEEQEVRELVRHERVELEDASAPSAAPAADVQGRSAADRPKTVPRSS